MKIPWIEIGVLIIIILVSYYILVVASPKIMILNMCIACYKKNWTGDIKGELSFSCEWSVSYPDYVNKTMKEWCDEQMLPCTYEMTCI